MKNLTFRSREKRINLTPTERIIKKELQRQKVMFRSQKVIGKYIVDFFLPELWVVLEVDGSSHIGRETQDAERDYFLENEMGFTVLRVGNADVYRKSKLIVATIRKLYSPVVNWRLCWGKIDAACYPYRRY